MKLSFFLSSSARTNPQRSAETPHASTAPAEWVVEAHPGNLFSDPDLASACSHVRSALVKRDGGTVLLAIPISADEPFPLMPVFRFGSTMLLGQQDYIVFQLKNGILEA